MTYHSPPTAAESSEPVEAFTQETFVVEKLVYGGDALGRLADGRVVFVPGALPGERVRVLLPAEQRSKKRLVAKLEAIEQPSPDRQLPTCEHFNHCGGCHWQHLSLPAQAAWKQQIVQESLQRIGKLVDAPVSPIQLTEPSERLHYRNKVAWFVSDADQPVRLAYRAMGSHRLVPFNTCDLLPEPLLLLARQLERQILPYWPLGVPWPERFEARQSTDGQQLLTLWLPQSTEKQAIETLAQWPWQEMLDPEKFPRLVGVVLALFSPTGANRPPVFQPLWGQDSLTEEVSGRSFRVSAGSFFQVNIPMAEQLVAWIRERISSDAVHCLDGYAGVGLFAVALARPAQQWTLMESVTSAVADAQHNLRHHGLEETARVEAGTLETVLLKEPDRLWDVALVDPPRGGCEPAVMEALAQQVKQQIFYVSCDPATLARDLAQLCKRGWQVHQVQPFDFFPHTYHVETVVQLLRTSV
ncbi:MAG: 23S rRNA (uracil(1939)-C(5))-methyltransferase RlmD [Candidatus Melainabacteria bacterium]|nr:23S rRNA (uracil(1939)-C(5))-methyltransferase RlmD [Candidatus Melainabacteria bacterium]